MEVMHRQTSFRKETKDLIIYLMYTDIPNIQLDIVINEKHPFRMIEHIMDIPSLPAGESMVEDLCMFSPDEIMDIRLSGSDYGTWHAALSRVRDPIHTSDN